MFTTSSKCRMTGRCDTRPAQVGLRTVLGWVRHYFTLAAFTLLHATVGRWAARSQSFRLRRWAEAWAWGSGQARSLSCSLKRLAAALLEFTSTEGRQSPTASGLPSPYCGQ